MSDVTYIDTGARLYERVVVPGYPVDRHGRQCRCHLDRARQRIEIGDVVPEEERDALTCRVVEAELGITSVRLVPVIGVARADGSPS